MSKDLRPITMYKCQHCGKLFKTPDKHSCRRDPDKTNCYSCKHWGHQFYIYFETDYRSTCELEEACNKHETSYVEEAYRIMQESGWYLDCPNYEAK